MIGLGYYGTHTPAVIRRNLLENPAWYTAYTPYQPEISQGRLEALLNFQTMVEDLTGLPVAGASMLDEATAAAEAMTLARRAKGKGSVFLADSDCLPQTLAVLADPGRAAGHPAGHRHGHGRADRVAAGRRAVRRAAAVPRRQRRDPRPAAADRGGEGARRAGRRRRRPARADADHAARASSAPTSRSAAPSGSACRWASAARTPATSASRDGLKRQLPGRLVGVSVDADGHPAYRLALQAREQHIRREKATSNICTAQVLLAVIAAMYASYHGPDGLAAIARRVHRKAVALAAAMKTAGIGTGVSAYFDTVSLIMPGQAAAAAARAAAAGFNVHVAGSGHGPGGLRRDHHRRAARRGRDRAGGASRSWCPPRRPRPSRPGLVRTSTFLAHPVFHSYRSETAMLRYLRRLADRDIALDRSMIPLGSCTMKLNAAAEMEADHLARVRRAAPVRPGRAVGRLPAADRRAVGRAHRDHRVRRDQPAAERGLAGRAGRPAGDPRPTTARTATPSATSA